ncbi:Protein of unknown function (DUF2798) [Methanomethylovorans hollandica DSM 15978]|uniref:DUF2798 domain-containing protein n=1 Tax=Methanomethylovorans hollandica (strain DSM 15978 / NBRC 107637 / DMS1) TaxID=867904 RepID=L0KZM1_METHD|nr:DUF2798 domain-containing protein [Methanomethylovorans hollandica]AGB49548.1 Protein of unknown function (DUF2798) [Methanomethylovorans hollandica DSM 15978]
MIKNKKENLIHTFIFVCFMAFVMTAYNTTIHQGFSADIIKVTWLSFPLTFIVAFTLEYFIVARYGMKLVFKLHKHHHTSFQKRGITALVFVGGMATLMSLFFSISTVGFSKDLPLTWISNLAISAVFAYPLVVFVAGPLVGFIFRMIFPEGCIVDIAK